MIQCNNGISDATPEIKEIDARIARREASIGKLVRHLPCFSICGGFD